MKQHDHIKKGGKKRMSKNSNVSRGIKIIQNPTYKERKRAREIKKQDERDKKRKAKQIDDFRQGKATSKEVSFDERSIWNKTLSDKTYAQFKEMGDTEEAISGFQKKRIVVSLVLIIFGVIMGLVFHPFAAGVGIVVAIIAYFMKGRKVDDFYRNWKFERQLAFSKFTRLVIPYLKSSGGNMALYTVFNRVVRRMDDPEDKNNLYQLMGEMGEDPTDIEPFLDFAQRSSGTDMSHLFMSTIFDFQQSTFDVTVIDELGKLASDDMMNSVDEIIDFKLRRFAMFPTKIVMSSFLLVAGLAVGMMIHSFQGIGFNGLDMDIEPAPEEQEVEPSDGDQSRKGTGGTSFIVEGDRYYI